MRNLTIKRTPLCVCTMKNLILIFIFCFSVNIWGQDEMNHSISKDTVYIYYDYSSSKMSKNISPKLGDTNSVLVTLKYPIISFSDWKKGEEDIERGRLSSRLSHYSSFSLIYVLECDDVNTNPKLFNDIPKDFLVLDKERFKKLDIIDWIAPKTYKELFEIVDKMKKANVVYVIDKVNTSNYILHKTRFVYNHG